MIVGFLAVGMLVGGIAGGTAVYLGYPFLVAVGFFSIFGSIAVLCSAVATLYALPFFRVRILRHD
ncbi:hypothetical protein AVO45_08565 [Ruegeria marisrubri]|uniref:Uncharacterized protein n=1 Tax=Ruegeria marisrubri TaxID=1685379 RepID=A0A0X3TX70_9RHOB|nr:hypothetical protein AVO45_08565 [Ruegeria marisrubri]